MALSIAAISLVTSVTTAALVSMEYLKVSTRRGVAVKVLKIDYSTISIFVRNNTDDDVILSDVGCIVYFPKDGSKQMRESLASRASGGSMNVDSLTFADVVNPFILSYETDPLVVETNEARTVELSLTNAVVLLPENDSGNLAVNVCTVENLGLGIGKNAWIFQPPELFYTEFGIFGLIKKATFDPASKTNATDIKSKLSGYIQ